MRAKSIASIVLVAAMMAGSCALAENPVQPTDQGDSVIAQRGDYRGDRYDGRRATSRRKEGSRASLRREDGRRYDRRDARGQSRHSNWREHRYDRRNDRIYYPKYQRHAYKGKYRRGAGPGRDMYKGKHLPRYYRSGHYRIRNWRGHGLYAPPRGHYWAQVGADYVLVAITTAIIFDLILHH